MPKLNSKLTLIVTFFVLLLVSFILVNPLRVINGLKDGTRRQEVETIASALTTYIEENDGSHPTHNNGSVLPTVLNEDILEKGIAANKIDQLDKYLNQLPFGPDGEEYKVGLNATGKILVAARLSDGSSFIK